MPYYVWKCEKCSAEEVVVSSIDERDDYPPELPKCGHGIEDMYRVISSTSVVRGPTWGKKKGELL